MKDNREKLIDEFMKRVQCLTLEVHPEVYDNFRLWAERVAQMLREDGEEIAMLVRNCTKFVKQITGLREESKGLRWKTSGEIERDKLKAELEKIKTGNKKLCKEVERLENINAEAICVFEDIGVVAELENLDKIHAITQKALKNDKED